MSEYSLFYDLCGTCGLLYTYLGVHLFFKTKYHNIIDNSTSGFDVLQDDERFMVHEIITKDIDVSFEKSNQNINRVSFGNDVWFNISDYSYNLLTDKTKREIYKTNHLIGKTSTVCSGALL